MKVIFIDPIGTLETAHNQNILKNKRLFKRLKKIVNATGAKIVLTSCYNHSIKRYKHHAVKEAFNKYNLEIYDYTSVTGIEKAVDIQEWLNKNFDVTNIVIIDNNFSYTEPGKVSMLSYLDQYVIPTEYGKSFYFASIKEGLSFFVAKNAIKILNSRQYKNILRKYIGVTHSTRKTF